MVRTDWPVEARMWMRAYPDLAIFSPRQREVIALVADGLDVADASRQLGISATVARGHLSKARMRVAIERRRRDPELVTPDHPVR